VTRRPAAALALAATLGVLMAALGGCTPVQWEHPVYGMARTTADLADCDHLAFQESWRSSADGGFLNQVRVHRLYDSPMMNDLAPRYGFQPYSTTGETRTYCMRAKGYELMPVAQSAANLTGNAAKDSETR
jgi:hypothetical protein